MVPDEMYDVRLIGSVHLCVLFMNIYENVLYNVHAGCIKNRCVVLFCVSESYVFTVYGFV